MTKTNLERYKEDFERLNKLGGRLYVSFSIESNRKDGESFEACASRLLRGEEEKAVAEIINKKLDFKSNYQSWYSEALAVVKQLIPDRLDDFRLYYIDTKRKKLDIGTYTIEDYLKGIRLGDGSSTNLVAAEKFKQQTYILKSAQDRLSSSLFDIRALVQADLFDSEIDAAESLLKGGYMRAAGAMCGVVIESHLHEVCATRSIAVKKQNPGIFDLSQALRDAGVIDIATWRLIQHLSDIRNKCDHKKASDPSDSEIRDLIRETRKIIKTIF